MKNLIRCVLVIFALISFPYKIHSAVTANQRALIVISELDSGGMPELGPIYWGLEQLMPLAISRYISDQYRDIITLDNEEATLTKFQSTVKSLARRSDIKAIDVMLSLHGSKRSLKWKDRTLSISEMERIFLSNATSVEKRKLRVVYSFACYGMLHNAAFLRMGFDVSAGAVAINANGETELVPFLRAWRNRVGFKYSFSTSNNSLALYAADEPVRQLGRRENNSLQDTDSRKVFNGFISTRISSDPK